MSQRYYLSNPLVVNTMPKARRSKKTPGVRGRHSDFSGIKLDFLESFKEEYLASNDAGSFYTTTTRAFIGRFGYDLEIGENPALGVDINSLAPKPVDPSLPEEDQVTLIEDRNEYQKVLRTVS